MSRAAHEVTFGDRLLMALTTGTAPTALEAGLPLPKLVEPSEKSATHYVITTVDARGRLADRSPLRLLVWMPRLQVSISVAAGVIVVSPQPDGAHTITSQGYLRLPASVRHQICLGVGDRVLVAACPDRGLLVAYPMPIVDTMILTYHRSRRDSDAA